MSLGKFFILNFIIILISLIFYSMIFSFFGILFNINDTFIYGFLLIFFQFFEKFNFIAIIIFTLVHSLLTYYFSSSKILITHSLFLILIFFMNSNEISTIIREENIVSINTKIGFITILITNYIFYYLLKQFLWKENI